jgi:hypothetical protein
MIFLRAALYFRSSTALFFCDCMKSFSYSAMALALCATLTVCCQSQPQPVQPKGTDSTAQVGEVLRNLIQDTVAISSLTDDDRVVLQRRYNNNRAVVSYRIIKDPFPRPDSLAVFHKLRCNMSATRSFIAELTDLQLEDRDLVWRSKLTGTGVTSDRLDFNRIFLSTRKDNNTIGGFQFSYGLIEIDRAEQYDLEKFPPYQYFVVVRYNPNKGLVLQDRVLTDPDIAR